MFRRVVVVAAVVFALLVIACQPKIVEVTRVVKETVVVEKEAVTPTYTNIPPTPIKETVVVEKVVRETVVVEKKVEVVKEVGVGIDSRCSISLHFLPSMSGQDLYRYVTIVPHDGYGIEIAHYRALKDMGFVDERCLSSIHILGEKGNPWGLKGENIPVENGDVVWVCLDPWEVSKKGEITCPTSVPSKAPPTATQTPLVQKIEVKGLDPESRRCLWFQDQNGKKVADLQLAEGVQTIKLPSGSTWFAIKGTPDGRCPWPWVKKEFDPDRIQVQPGQVIRLVFETVGGQQQPAPTETLYPGPPTPTDTPVMP